MQVTTLFPQVFSLERGNSWQTSLGPMRLQGSQKPKGLADAWILGFRGVFSDKEC